MTFGDLFNKFIAAFFIMLVGIILGKLSQRFTFKFMKEIEVNYFLHKTTKFRLALDNLVSLVIAYIIYIGAFILALNTAGMLKLAFLIATASLSLAIFFMFLLYLITLFPNLYAGFRLRKEGIL